ncbi:MAG: DUF2723 domain-containing protein, partial [Bacteroidales bacterium]|nr:DUF2723 domain-containing protein [Bacteroidales bacterium]
MEQKKFRLINNILGVALLVISAVVYLSTIEPTTSFWDCGEFIASSYKLEVGHPPGNPVFQVIARFFTLFADKENAALMVNAMSAICSALTIMFLFWTITHIARRLFEKISGELTLPSVVTIFASGVAGALVYTFSDTFWFSAVEGEVYAMSSLFTAAVFWAMLKWEEESEQPYANRWIVLIAFLMGLSIGVHLLNLLTIPALVFIYYYKNYKVTTARSFYVLLLSAVILAVILYGIVPLVPKIASWFDLLFVNVFGLGFNSGAAFFVLALLAVSLWIIHYSRKTGRVLLNTIMLCFTMIIIGYSSFAVVIIRSSANTPTNENQPDNPFSLVRYLGREQYGSNPLIYGETYASTYDIVQKDYYVKLGERYEKVPGPVKPIYDSDAKMLFPRMWSSSADHIRFYESYTRGRGTPVTGSDYKMPRFSDNLSFFFDYQVNWMYLRYFMWNFAGRQNDIQGTIPGELFRGNWESGIGFIDKARLGDQSDGPDYIVNNKAKNHYYMLPLLLGLSGLFFQLSKDKRNWWIVMLLFLLTGVAVVVYLNQPPFQPRERDYAYAGSFYAFSIWVGLGIASLYEFLRKYIPAKFSAPVVAVISLLIPLQMASENWDDHDRSNRYTARDLAYNYLNSCGEQAVIVTHGDNDTFPLWYIQEVEGVRTDVRVMNTSLLGTDWYIDQMQYKVYESEPVKFSIPRREYLYGTNDMLQIVDRLEKPLPIKAVIDLVSNPEAKIRAQNGRSYSFFASRKLILPVNIENALKAGIISEADTASALREIELNLPEGKNILTKAELMILDMLANYNWDRPICFVAMGGDLEIGIKDYLDYNGFVYKLVPLRTEISAGSPGRVDGDNMYNKVMNIYRWGNMSDSTVNIDYQNLLTFSAVISGRNIHVVAARALLKEGKGDKAIEVLDRMQQIFVPYQFPLNCSLLPSMNEYAILEAIDIYYAAGAKDKGAALLESFREETFRSVSLFAKPYKGTYMSKSDIEQNLTYLFRLSDIMMSRGEEERGKQLQSDL